MVTPGGRYSVLIVEDNPDIVIGLQDLLQHDGYEVTVAGTCAAAIALTTNSDSMPFSSIWDSLTAMGWKS